MVIGNALVYGSELSPLGVSQLRFFCSARVLQFSPSSWKMTISGRSSSSRTWRGFGGPFVLRSRGSSGSWCSGSGLPRVSRRGLVVGSVPASWIAAGLVGAAATGALAMAAMAGQGGRQQSVLATRKGMQLFAQGDVKGSLEKFDEALELDPQSLPYLWQRGLSLYYVDQFEEGAKQFRDDVAINPNDTEEAIWCFLCEAQYLGVGEARQRFLERVMLKQSGSGVRLFKNSLFALERLQGNGKVGPDRRPIMKEIYNLFRYGGSTEELLQVVDATEGADYFYANLYAGLYHEAHSEFATENLSNSQRMTLPEAIHCLCQKRQDAAKDAILAAVHSFYGTRSGDYMAILARVHAKCRGWKVSLGTFA